MNINKLSQNIWEAEIIQESKNWALKYNSGLDKLFSLVNDSIFDCSQTSLEKSLSYNYCINKLEEYVNNSELNFILSQKYFEFLFNYKDDIRLEKLPSYFYKILIYYFIKASSLKYDFQKEIIEYIIYLISSIDKFYQKSKNKYLISLEAFCKALIHIFALFDAGEMSNDLFNYSCKLFSKLFGLIYELSNINGPRCIRNLISQFLNSDSCAFYLDKSDNIKIKTKFYKRKTTSEFQEEKFYKEHLFRYALAMKNKKYHIQELNKFKENQDTLNYILWSDKYLKDVIKTCIYSYFKFKNEC